MRGGFRNTVERLDRPSAYYTSRNNNKRRRTDRGREDRDGDSEMADQKPEEKPEEDPLANATTLYVGNLLAPMPALVARPSQTCCSVHRITAPPSTKASCSSFYTTEEQVYDLFSKCGEIKRLIMGLDRFQKTPCGFCFVEYYTHQDALDCLKYVGGTKLDERVIRTDLDPGFEEGRQYGRGKSGGQVRDEYRDDYDEGRGGLGRAIKSERMMDNERNRDNEGDDQMERDYGRLR
ncbi:hypothetical protein BKA67DRAFT_646314 [Truncatella angustata]|uniref:Nuclear cap-binding protein subunit 2 n=1 Tax=Truncatella angustata TaxID=152316 RepID=A0A9P8ULT4_9PEZI|nr:uncharacterized protein BKA67DRAFT_646314 [Truncatella angustata]KAH6654612.1 hypothetical protein BKA67DRAFT_646314 [Truncatella angustata]